MRKVTLGCTGLEVSAVGFGGIPIQRVSEADAAGAIHAALDLGVTFIDTATGYSDSQRKIGAALEGRREKVVLASKSGATTKDAAIADVERSCAEMRVEHIDIYQLHGVNSPERRDAMLGPGGSLEGLLVARDRGLVGHVGFTSHSLDMALELVEIPEFETIQFPFNLVTSEPAEALIPKARERGLGFIVMKPLCGGQYSDAELAGGRGAHRRVEGARRTGRARPRQALLPPLRLLRAVPQRRPVPGRDDLRLARRATDPRGRRRHRAANRRDRARVHRMRRVRGKVPLRPPHHGDRQGHPREGEGDPGGVNVWLSERCLPQGGHANLGAGGPRALGA